MKTLLLPWFLRRTAAGMGLLGAGLWVVWLLGAEPPRTPRLVLSREGQTTAGAAGSEAPAPGNGVVPDDLRRKYDQRIRADFQVSSTEDVSIFVEATGVQVPSQSGWRTEAEDHRGQIWRLKAGTGREVCVARPESTVWRIYVRYGIEMKGWPLWKAQMREAWLLRSFSNWSGKAWGGGRYAGSYELVSEEFTE